MDALVDEGISEDVWRSLWVYDLPGDKVRQWSPTGLNPWEACWLGDDAVLAVTSPQPDESAWYTAVLTRIELTGGAAQVLTSEVQLGLPSAASGGGRLAIVQAICNDRGVIAGDLFVGTVDALDRVDTAGVDVSFTQWLDADRVGFLGIRGLETVAAIHDASTGKTTELWSSTESSSGLRHPDGAFLYYAWTPLLVKAGYAVLNPNPRGSSGRGQEFARHVFGDMGGEDTQDFASAVDALAERGIADPTRVAVMGASYGGFMSAWLTTQGQRIAAAIPIAPVTNWYSQNFTRNIPFFDALFLGGDPEVPGDNFHARSPVAHASKVRTPCLNVAGALDKCTPAGQALEFHQAVLEHGGTSSLVIYPQVGHGVSSYPAMIDFCTRVLDFFALHV